MENKETKETRGIGLCLAFKGANYGALLQSFATQYELEKRGIYTEILDYTRGAKNKYIFSAEAFIFLSIKKMYIIATEKLKVIGITGTKGKTTTTYLVKSILENARKEIRW